MGDREAVLRVRADDEESFETLAKKAAGASKRIEALVKRAMKGWEDYFAMIKRGGGESAAHVAAIEKNVKALQQQFESAMSNSGPVLRMTRALDDISTKLAKVPEFTREIGAAFGALATPLGPVIQAWQTIVDLQALARGENVPFARALAIQVGQQQVGAIARITGANAIAQGTTAAVGLGIGQAAITEQQRLLRNQPRGGGGGGGGGGAAGMTPEQKADLLREQEELFAERKRALADELRLEAQARTDAVKDSLSEEDRLNREHYDRQRALVERNAAMHEHNIDVMIAMKDHELEAFEDAERKKQEAMEATAATLHVYAKLLLQGGTAAQTAGRMVLAVESAVSALLSAKALGSAFEALGRYDFGAAVNFFASATAYGVAAGMGFAEAFGGGGGRRRSSSGGHFRDGPSSYGRALGPGYGSADGGGGSGGGTIQVHQHFESTGGVIPDRQYHEASRHIREMRRRGYI